MGKPHRLSWREIQDFRRDQLNTTLRLTEKLGRVAPITMMGVKLYLVADPEVIRELLIKHPRYLHRDPFTHRVLGRIVGNGVFIAEDDEWQRKRKLVQPIFHAASIQDFVDTFARLTHEMCQGWRVGDAVQLDQEMMALALRIICQTMFGADIAPLTPQIGTLMQSIMCEAEAQLRFALPLPAWLPTPGNLRQRRALRQIRTLLLEIIRKRQARIAQGDETGDDLLAMLLNARDEAGQSLNEKEVLDECLTIFVAGHETTAVALTWTWLLLLQHPDILATLRREVHQSLGTTPATYHRLGQMTYLTQVVKESLRYYPPAPGFGRTPTARFSVNGHDFKPGDNIIISTYALHRQADYYPQPLKFDPDRFRADAEQPPRYAYLPFGAGSRTCIGNAFAMLEMQIVLATMLQSVELALIPGQEIVPETVVTLRPRNGVRVSVETIF